MNWLNTILLLTLAFFGVFAEAACDWPRRWLGAQFNLLPPLVVYAALRLDVPALTLISVCGALLADSLSGNPLGVSILPLLWVGLAILRWRELLLGHSAYAQGVLGGLATATVTIATAALLLTVGERPLLDWGSAWQLAVVSACGAALTPLVFLILDFSERMFAYRPVATAAFRSDREIKRGKY